MQHYYGVDPDGSAYSALGQVVALAFFAVLTIWGVVSGNRRLAILGGAAFVALVVRQR